MEKSIDILLCNPRHADYLWFRYNFHWIEKLVNKVYIALTQGLEPDISQFLTNAKEYKNVRWVKPPFPNGKTDWRHLAVKEMLESFTKADYVLFLEQDFLMTKEFLEKVISKLDDCDFIFYQEGGRIHPAFALCPQESVKHSSMDFSVKTGYDHFYDFFRTLPYRNSAELREIGLREGEDFMHLAGLTQNYWCFKLGQPFYKPSEFLAYNELCLELPIEHEPNFRLLMEQIKEKFGTGDVGKLEKFFPEEGGGE